MSCWSNACASAGTLRRPPRAERAGVAHLYLHTPFCAAKCPYCDFNSVAGRQEEHAAYVEALLEEVRRLPPGPYATVFLGGGTPTFLGARLLDRLLGGVRAHVRLAEGYEWTCEANPGSSDAERFAVLAEHGVNRLSIGVQSTQAHHLRTLGRVHGADEAARTVELAVARFPRVSADLIHGLPGQTMPELDADLDLLERSRLRHASIYHLTYEPGTEFHARRQRGEMHEVDTELSQRQATRIAERLAGMGLRRYETSNFAVPGEESRHNLAYWTQADYQAAGAGAVSMVDGVRATRRRHPGMYASAIREGGDAVELREMIDARTRLREAWMLGLRLVRGVAIGRLEALGDARSRWQATAEALIGFGLLAEAEGRLALTEEGRLLQDEVTLRLMP